MTMRTLLIIGIFATLFLASVEGQWTTMYHPEPTTRRTKSEPRSGYNSNDCVLDVNHIRRKFAEKHSIGNMNKLVFDYQLSNFLEHEKYDDCLKEVWETRTHSGEAYLKNIDDMANYLLNPGATKVACFEKCWGAAESTTMMVVDIQPDRVIGAAAGSRCGHGRIGMDGLCVEPTTPKPRMRYPEGGNRSNSDNPGTSNSGDSETTTSFMERNSYWISIMMMLVLVAFM